MELPYAYIRLDRSLCRCLDALKQGEMFRVSIYEPFAIALFFGFLVDKRNLRILYHVFTNVFKCQECWKWCFRWYNGKKTFSLHKLSPVAFSIHADEVEEVLKVYNSPPPPIHDPPLHEEGAVTVLPELRQSKLVDEKILT